MIHPYIHFILSGLGVAGFVLCKHLYKCKQRKQPLICPMRMSCDFVTTSKYSKFLGIHLEILGMIYYGLVTIIHASMLVFPNFASPIETTLGLAASTCAFVFSVYLTGIQAFVLKKWCTWCLCSATFCALIFITTYFSAPVGFLPHFF